MLSSLRIQNIVLIERLDVEWRSGLSVLTGETGAGKSIILDSLSLALGARGDGGLVRSGEESGSVTAVFDLPLNHPVRALLRENDIDDEGDILLRRVQRADGRTKAFVNDQPVSAGLLRDLGLMLVEIHGQHADRALVDTDSHRALVDAFGGLAHEGNAVGIAYRSWRQKERALKDLRVKVEASENERDYLRAVLEELKSLQPEAGEEEELAARRQSMMNVEKIATDINEAYEVVSGHASPVPTLSSLLRQLERKAEQAPGLLDGAIEGLTGALDGLDRMTAALEEAIRTTNFDPQELERVEERLFALRAAARKHKVTADQLTDLTVRFMNDLEAIETGEERLQALEDEERRAFLAYHQEALILSARRGEAAGDLANQVMQELPALKLEAARFSVALASDLDRPGASGYDTVEFHVQTNPGTRPGPIMKVASGGELSRFLLALKVSLADKGSAPTLIFDEIDTGVGGAVAEAIGARLSRLAEKVQVLSVTHAPQVAARAQHHFLIHKAAVKGENRVATDLTLLDEAARREEIARMLAGHTITDEARAAADQLMAGGKR
ncbi:MAG: DNA repair protein RecN [Rhizobiales bacterium]|nr:DNA repair protein RecN [Hyphomicrobiales bacterium]